MTDNIISLHKPTEGQLWARYQKLAQAALDDPKLMADRAHCEQMARAHAQWKTVFLRECA